MERSSGEEDASEKVMAGVWERTISARNVEVFHSQVGRSQKKFLWTLLRKNKKESKVSGNMEPPFKKSSGTSQKKCGYRLRPQTMRRAHIAMKHGNWESFQEEYRKEGRKAL